MSGGRSPVSDSPHRVSFNAYASKVPNVLGHTPPQLDVLYRFYNVKVSEGQAVRPDKPWESHPAWLGEVIFRGVPWDAPAIPREEVDRLRAAGQLPPSLVPAEARVLSFEQAVSDPQP